METSKLVKLEPENLDLEDVHTLFVAHSLQSEPSEEHCCLSVQLVSFTCCLWIIMVPV